MQYRISFVLIAVCIHAFLLVVSAPLNTKGIVMSQHSSKGEAKTPKKDGPIGISNAGICTQAVGAVSIDQSVLKGLPAVALTLSLGRGAG